MAQRGNITGTITALVNLIFAKQDKYLIERSGAAFTLYFSPDPEQLLKPNI